MSSKLKEAKRLARLSQQIALSKRLGKLKKAPPSGKKRAAEAGNMEDEPTKKKLFVQNEVKIKGQKRYFSNKMESASPERLRGYCYCESVKFEVEVRKGMDASPLYCHCESCRRAHASALYQIVYIKPENFQITEGKKLVKEFSKNKNVKRCFCMNCGSRVANILVKSQRGPEYDGTIGFFPSLLEKSAQDGLPDIFRPTQQLFLEEAILPKECLEYLLQKN